MTIQLTTAAHCLAMLRSRQAIKSELRAYGLKPSHLSAREITSWAQLWLDDHAAELIPEALANARAMILKGALGKRAQRRPDPSKLSSCKYHAQNGGME
jgi:hypothetical protein